MTEMQVVIDGPAAAIVEQFGIEIPVRVGALAHALGLGVLRSTLQPGISGQIEPSEDYPSGFVIRVNRHEAKHRQRFTIAHEIGHYMLHRDRIGAGIKDTKLYRSKLSNAMEAQANRYAANILMPIRKLREHLSDLHLPRNEESANILAGIFGVSNDAMEIRLGLR